MSIKARLIRRLLAAYFASFHQKNIQAQRDSQERNARFSRVPGTLTCRPVDAHQVPSEWIIPQGKSQGVILYFHGGAYVVGSINTHRQFIGRLVEAAGCEGLAVNYRLAPEHPFPAALEDALTAFRWLLDQNYDPGQIVLAGDSSGGGLALATLVALRESSLPLPAGAVCISPWTDLAITGMSIQTKARFDFVLTPESLPRYAGFYAGDQDVRDPLISPLYADFSDLPPLYILVGEDEILLDDATRLAAKAREAGVIVTLDIWEGMFHVFPLVPGLSESKEAVTRLARFIRSLFTEEGEV
jgi:acetyl esterase/lipase